MAVDFQELRQKTHQIKFAINGSIYFQALHEFFVIYIASNIPLIASIITYYVQTTGADYTSDTFIQIINNNFKPEEILIYVSTLLAPFVYILIAFARARRHFPFYSFFVFLTAAIYLYSLIVFSMFRVSAISNHQFIADTAPYFYFISLAMWYFSLVYGKKLQKPDRDITKSSAQELINRLRDDKE